MGMRLFSDSCGGISNSPLPNPNPKRFRIVEIAPFGKYTAYRVHYPDCSTYGGEKVLVYRATNVEIARKMELDPHFLEEGCSPIARFPATKEGWADAKAYAQAKSHDQKER